MPHLDTVLNNISNLLENEEHKVSPSMESLGAFGGNMARLASKRVAPAVEREASSKLTVYASDIGKGCMRQLWYKTNQPEVTNKIDAPTNWRFLQGDVIEETTLFLVEQAGHEVTDRQSGYAEVVDDVEFRGRIDCRIDGILVDVKSMSDFGFKKATKLLTYPDQLDDPWGYGYQLAFYERGFSTIESPAFFMVNKVSGEMAYRHLEPTFTNTSFARMINVARVVQLPSATSVDRVELKPADAVGQKLSSMCHICPFMFKCWDGQGVRGFLYAEGIRWYGKVNKPARVPEVSFEFIASGGEVEIIKSF